jgi:glucose/arabinose dehydrogenase
MRHFQPGIGLTRHPHSVFSKSFFVVLAMAVTMSTLTSIVNGAALRPDSKHIAVASLQLNLTPIVTSGLTKPLYLTHAGDSRLFIVERAGVIRIYQGGALLSQPFLDISSIVQDVGFEEGLLGLAFPPTFSPSHAQFYVYYVNNAGDLVLARYNVSAGNPNIADPASAEIVLTIPHPGQANHNGAQIAFGPQDGYLYIGPGDGGIKSSTDPGKNAQDPAVLAGKILRIDVETGDPSTYTIPPTNPYRQTPGFRPEIWTLGFRNPYRFSFDRTTGDLFIADVGQSNIEEIDYEPGSDPGGRNYGWDCYEGSNSYDPVGCGPVENYTFPVWEYNHALGCSVTGGYVYRGRLFPDMIGIYFYGDFCSGRIWGLSFDGTNWQNTEYLDSTLSISSFGEDVNGEVYVVDFNGGVYRLEGTGTGPTPGASPTRTPTTVTLPPTTPRSPTPTRTPTNTTVTLSPPTTRSPTPNSKATMTRTATMTLTATPTISATATKPQTTTLTPTATRTRTPTRPPKIIRTPTPIRP